MAASIRVRQKEAIGPWITVCFFAKNVKNFLSGFWGLFLGKVLRFQQIFQTILMIAV